MSMNVLKIVTPAAHKPIAVILKKDTLVNVKMVTLIVHPIFLLNLDAFVVLPKSVPATMNAAVQPFVNHLVETNINAPVFKDTLINLLKELRVVFASVTMLVEILASITVPATPFVMMNQKVIDVNAFVDISIVQSKVVQKVASVSRLHHPHRLHVILVKTPTLTIVMQLAHVVLLGQSHIPANAYLDTLIGHPTPKVNLDVSAFLLNPFAWIRIAMIAIPQPFAAKPKTPMVIPADAAMDMWIKAQILVVDLAVFALRKSMNAWIKA